MTNAEMPSPDSIEQEPHSGQLERPSDDNRGLHPSQNNSGDYGGSWELPDLATEEPDELSGNEQAPVDPLTRIRKIREEQDLDNIHGKPIGYGGRGYSSSAAEELRKQDHNFLDNL